MNAPLTKFGLFGDPFSLVLAFIIGIGFGFFLERAGFGSARKLAAQFYFTDLAVFKVMFTAIITAMLGVFYLAWLGFLDLQLVYVSTTYLAPQVIGGLLLGVGFVVGGYCPGTSCVALSTGKMDALVYLAGILAGILAFGVVYPWIEDFYFSADMGQITLPELLNMPYGLVVALVVLMAIGGFSGATWIERKMSTQKGS